MPPQKPRRGRPKQNTHAKYVSLYDDDIARWEWLTEHHPSAERNASRLIRILLREEYDRRNAT